MAKRLNTKDIGIRLALAGLGSALSIVFVTLSYYVSVMTITFTILSCVGVLLPLTKDFYREGVIVCIVTALAGFFIVNIKIVPFAMCCSIYVVFSILAYNKLYKKGWIAILLVYVFKVGYSCLVFYILYKVTSLFVVNVDKISVFQYRPENIIYLILNTFFTICFIIYDTLVIEGYRYGKKLADKIIRGKHG